MDAAAPGFFPAPAGPDAVRPAGLPDAMIEFNSPAPAVDSPLKWIGMIGLGSFVGFAITAAVFLFLTGDDRAAPPAPQSSAAPAMPAQESEAAGVDLVAAEVETPKDNAAEVQLILDRLVAVPPAQPIDEEVSDVESAASDPGVEYASEPGVEYASGPAAAEGEHVHVVQEGETLWRIAAQGSVGLHELASRNGLSPDAQIVAGDTIVIPAPR